MAEYVFIIGVGPSIYGISDGSWFSNGYDLAPYFLNRNLQLVSTDTSNWSPVFGGAITFRVIPGAGFSTKDEAHAAAVAAINDAGFEATAGHVNVPLGSILPGYPDNADLGPEDQTPGLLDGLAKQFGLQTSTIELVLLALLGVGLFVVLKK